MYKYPEIIIGLVYPIGSNPKDFIDSLKNLFIIHGYNLEKIKVSEDIALAFYENNICSDKKYSEFIKNINKLPFSIKTFLKMEICSKIRQERGSGFLAKKIIEKISQLRKVKGNEDKKTIYLIDQLKHLDEFNILNSVYGENYIQISCFSNENIRLKKLNEKINLCKNTDNSYEFIKCDINKLFIEDYIINIAKNDAIELMKKDLNDPIGNHGQQISKLFHKSHYYINLDKLTPSVYGQGEKFINLLFGLNEDLPTQDEFGMSIAYAVSKRSNFTGDRHIGACLISENGEVISAGSIRAPNNNSNTNKCNRDSVQEMYNKYYLEIKEFQQSNEFKNIPENIKKYLIDSLEYHPCTHAEISAIIDAAKLGISIKNATLYTTTFPCHLCAKDIITSGINKVVFIEPYPKSKAPELYSRIIEIDPEDKVINKVPFYTFYGAGPNRYNYVFGLDNKRKNDESVPPRLRNRIPEFYISIENLIINNLDKNEIFN